MHRLYSTQRSVVDGQNSGNAMASDLPSKTPGTSSGSYVRLAVIMLLIAGALVVGKLTLMRSEPPAPSAAVAVSEQPKVEVVPPPPPPPPPEEPSASASASAAPVAKVAKGGGGCTGECKGEVSAELRTYLAGRAAQGRKCYERALQRWPPTNSKIPDFLLASCRCFAIRFTPRRRAAVLTLPFPCPSSHSIERP
jgi:hypothetical protein